MLQQIKLIQRRRVSAILLGGQLSAHPVAFGATRTLQGKFSVVQMSESRSRPTHTVLAVTHLVRVDLRTRFRVSSGGRMRLRRAMLYFSLVWKSGMGWL